MTERTGLQKWIPQNKRAKVQNVSNYTSTTCIIIYTQIKEFFPFIQTFAVLYIE